MDRWVQHYKVLKLCNKSITFPWFVWNPKPHLSMRFHYKPPCFLSKRKTSYTASFHNIFVALHFWVVGALFSLVFFTFFLLFKPSVAVVWLLGAGRASLQFAMNWLSGRGAGTAVWDCWVAIAYKPTKHVFSNVGEFLEEQMALHLLTLHLNKKLSLGPVKSQSQ